MDTSTSKNKKIEESKASSSTSSLSFHLFEKPEILTPKRCKKIVKLARKRLRSSNSEEEDHKHSATDINNNSSIVEDDKGTQIVTHSQIQLGKLLGNGSFSSVYE